MKALMGASAAAVIALAPLCIPPAQAIRMGDCGADPTNGQVGQFCRDALIPNADQTLQQICNAVMKWPQPVPNAVGKTVTDIVEAPLPPVTDSVAADWFWSCVPNIAAIAPDGHDVMNDKMNSGQTWRITSQSPPAGTPVAENQTITLKVAP
jgi:hypothetical protein